MMQRVSGRGVVRCVLLLALAALGGCKLVVANMFVDVNGYVTVVLKNTDTLTVPANKGDLAIYVDERLVREYRLSDIPDQTFRQPGQSTTFTTDVRLSGTGHRLLVRVDRAREFTADPYQSALSQYVDAPTTISSWDYVLSDLSTAADNTLRVNVKNAGTATAAAHSATIYPTVNGTALSSFTTTLPTLAANSVTTVTVTGAIIPNNARVDVRIIDSGAERDTTNNFRTEVLPSGPSVAGYATLLADSRIRDSLRWQRTNGVTVDYPNWTAAEKNDLDQALLRLEEDAPPAVTGLPTVVIPSGWPFQVLEPADAWKMYIEYAAQALWVDQHNIVPWHIVDFPQDQRRSLLDGNSWFVFESSQGKYSLDVHYEVMPWNRRIAFNFLRNMGLVGGAQLDTVYGLTDWMRGRLLHVISVGSNDPTGHQATWGYSGHPPVDRVLYAKPQSPNWTMGCWGTTGLYAALLRTINIPTVAGNTILSNGQHARPVFPSLGISMAHGDDPYSGLMVGSGSPTSIDKIFFSLAQIDSRYVNPPIVNCDASSCVSTADQIGYNYAKDGFDRAVADLTDYILYKYATTSPSSFDALLTGNATLYKKPLFTASERATILANVKAKVTELGDGSLELGEDRVAARYKQWFANEFYIF